MQRWTSEPLQLVLDPAAPWVSADLDFVGVEHDGPSFTVLLFFNKPDVADDVDVTTEPSYAGPFSVFGHGSCCGDQDHCEVPTKPISAFDRRRMHPLTPITVTVDVTAALQRVEGDQATVTALAASVDSEVTEPLRFRALGLATYK